MSMGKNYFISFFLDNEEEYIKYVLNDINDVQDEGRLSSTLRILINFGLVKKGNPPLSWRTDLHNDEGNNQTDPALPWDAVHPAPSLLLYI